MKSLFIKPRRNLWWHRKCRVQCVKLHLSSTVRVKSQSRGDFNWSYESYVWKRMKSGSFRGVAREVVRRVLLCAVWFWLLQHLHFFSSHCPKRTSTERKLTRTLVNLVANHCKPLKHQQCRQEAFLQHQRCSVASALELGSWSALERP